MLRQLKASCEVRCFPRSWWRCHHWEVICHSNPAKNVAIVSPPQGYSCSTPTPWWAFKFRSKIAKASCRPRSTEQLKRRAGTRVFAESGTTSSRKRGYARLMFFQLPQSAKDFSPTYVRALACRPPCLSRMTLFVDCTWLIWSSPTSSALSIFLPRFTSVSPGTGIRLSQPCDNLEVSRPSSLARTSGHQKFCPPPPEGPQSSLSLEYKSPVTFQAPSRHWFWPINPPKNALYDSAEWLKQMLWSPKILVKYLPGVLPNNNLMHSLDLLNLTCFTRTC